MSGTLTGAAYSGIVPGGALGQQYAAITRRAVIPSVYVNIYQSHPLLSMFLGNAQAARGGVSGITIPVQGASFTNFSWGSFAGDFPMPEDQAAIQNAQFNLKLGMVPMGFFGMEAIIQSSEVIIPKLRAVTSDASVVMKQALAQALYTNSASNSNALDSLPAAYDNGTNTSSYGGIARTNSFWQGQYYPNAGAISSRNGMTKTIMQIQTGAGGEDPDWGVMNPADWTTLMQDFMALEMIQQTPKSRYGKGDVVNSGFRAIQVLNTPIFPDPFCPRGQAFFGHSRYIGMYLSEAAPFIFSGWQSAIPQGQIADIGVLITALNLVCAKPSSGAWVNGITGAAWPNVPGPPAVL